jgi:hypothetical protein
MFAIDLLNKDLSSHVLSPIVGLSLLSLFAGVIISLRQNRRLTKPRAVYVSAGAPALNLSYDQPLSVPTPESHPVSTISADPAELTLLHAINQCLPTGVTALHGLRTSDLLRWEGGSAPSASLTRERLSSVIYDTRSGKACGIIQITDTSTASPLLDSTLAATGLPVLHLEARRAYSPGQLTYLLQEGLGLATPQVV